MPLSARNRIKGVVKGIERGEVVATITIEIVDPAAITSMIIREAAEDPDLKERLYGEIDWASSYFEGPEDPSYVLLHMESKAFMYRKPGEYDIVQFEVS